MTCKHETRDGMNLTAMEKALNALSETRQKAFMARAAQIMDISPEELGVELTKRQAHKMGAGLAGAALGGALSQTYAGVQKSNDGQALS